MTYVPELVHDTGESRTKRGGRHFGKENRDLNLKLKMDRKEQKRRMRTTPHAPWTPN